MRWQLREDRAEDTEFVTIAYWEIVEGMSRFAGPDPRRIHHLPRDTELLIKLSESVQVPQKTTASKSLFCALRPLSVLHAMRLALRPFTRH